MPTFPIIHLNGTSGDALIEQNRQAYNAVFNAISDLNQAAPNARDFYVSQDPAAYTKAQREHEARVHVLRCVLNDLEAIVENLTEQQEAREAQKR